MKKILNFIVDTIIYVPWLVLQLFVIVPSVFIWDTIMAWYINIRKLIGWVIDEPVAKVELIMIGEKYNWGEYGLGVSTRLIYSIRLFK